MKLQMVIIYFTKNKCFARMYCYQLNSRNMCPYIQMDESKCDLRTNIQWTAKNHDNEVKCTCGNRKKKLGPVGTCGEI